MNPVIYFSKNGDKWCILVDHQPAAIADTFEDISQAYQQLKDKYFAGCSLPLNQEYPPVFTDGNFVYYSEYINQKGD